MDHVVFFLLEELDQADVHVGGEEPANVVRVPGDKIRESIYRVQPGVDRYGLHSRLFENGGRDTVLLERMFIGLNGEYFHVVACIQNGWKGWFRAQLEDPHSFPELLNKFLKNREYEFQCRS